MAGWNLQQAAHLLRRMTFGFTHSQLRQALADGPEKTLARLEAQPADYAEFEQTMAALTPREPSPDQTAQLQLYRILNSPWPCHEKSALLAIVGQAASLRVECISAQAVLPPAGRASSPPALQKSPLEFALNLAIPLQINLAPAKLQTQLSALGQNAPYHLTKRPWLNPYTRVARSNLAATILKQAQSFPDRQTILESLLQTEPPQLAQLDGRDLVQAIANLPEFQLL
jgi:hypothetical protein